MKTKSPAAAPVARLPASLAFALTLVAGMVGSAGGQTLSPAKPQGQDMKFEGVWVRPGSATLIKQFHNYLALSGKDEASAWSARCVLGGPKAVCRGSGTTTTGFQFVYESVLVLDGATLRDTWRAQFPGEQELRGDDVLRALPLPAADLTPRVAR